MENIFTVTRTINGVSCCGRSRKSLKDAEYDLLCDFLKQKWGCY